jgi:N,N-dimethylformamidase
MRDKTVTGYCAPFSATHGETIRFMVSTYAPGDCEVDLVRIISGDDSEGGPGLVEEPVAAAFAGQLPGRHQPIYPGSCGLADDGPAIANLTEVTLAAWIWPTLPGMREQTILGSWDADRQSGFRLFLDQSGALAFQAGNGKGQMVQATTGTPLKPRRWYRISASFDALSGTMQVIQKPFQLSPGQRVTEQDIRFDATLASIPEMAVQDVPLLIGAHHAEGRFAGHYNGKIDRPRIASRALDAKEIADFLAPEPAASIIPDLIAHWDFSRGITTDRFTDLGPAGRHGRVINLPARAMTGFNWTGEAQDWGQQPEQFGAIHFHDDDLYDAGWDPDFEYVVPGDLPSGVYAARIRHGDDTDRIPFVVRPPVGTANAPVAFLLPTASYLAYANYRLRLKANPIFGDGIPQNGNDAFLARHPELGNSTYDLHSDRSGVAYSSRLRPVTNLKPGDNRPWGFPADCNILAWLQQSGQPFDVITDEDLHVHGEGLLRPYRAILTGSHPEYHSTAMLNGIESWLGKGGRLMYLGGNGFYWRVAFRDDLPGVLEVRRAEDGTRAWIAEPGEYYQSFNGEYGGLWRRIGRAPNRLVGVGFAAQGFDKSGHFRKTTAATDPRAAFIFAGIADEIIGNFGSIGGGAAGEEIDRHDIRLGSPHHALVVATSEGLGPDMLRTKEEFLSTIPWFDDPKVRADMTFFECPNGGAVFSTGSISYAASLFHENYDNNVARLTANVLRRFVDPTPFDMPKGAD